MECVATPKGCDVRARSWGAHQSMLSVATLSIGIVPQRRLCLASRTAEQNAREADRLGAVTAGKEGVLPRSS